MEKTNYTIGVIAPSFPSEGKRAQSVRAAISYLERSGHSVRLSDGVFSIKGYKSGSAQQRASELGTFLKDPQIDLIMATTGGYNSNEILEFLDLEDITPSRKVFVGYSDCTAISMALERHRICTSVNGPMLVDFNDYPECFEQLFRALSSSARRFINETEAWESTDSGKFKMAPMRRLPNKDSISGGLALAANLSTLCLMLGTPYLPDFKDRILFVEYDREEQRALPSLERFMWQLRHAGILPKLSGLVFGALQPSVAAEETAIDSIERILNNVTANYSYPVIFNAQFGHIYPSWVVVNGSMVLIDGKGIGVGGS